MTQSSPSSLTSHNAPKIPDEHLQFIADYIAKEIGIIFNHDNFYQLHQRLEKVAQYLGVAPNEIVPKAIHEGISSDFKQYLLDIATNNETSFFRDPKVFSAIERHIFPNLRKNRPESLAYRCWSTAASFGQEPFSLAMLTHDFLRTNPSHPRIEIQATDIAEHALGRCREARYSQIEVQRGLPALKLVQFFTKSGENHWTFKPEHKAMVAFKSQNLLDPFNHMGQFDLILCRYVLIYQNDQKKKEIIERLIKCLYPKGFLILGASETILGLTQQMDQVNIDGAVIYQKKERS